MRYDGRPGLCLVRLGRCDNDKTGRYQYSAVVVGGSWSALLCSSQGPHAMASVRLSVGMSWRLLLDPDPRIPSSGFSRS